MRELHRIRGDGLDERLPGGSRVQDSYDSHARLRRFRPQPDNLIVRICLCCGECPCCCPTPSNFHKASTRTRIYPILAEEIALATFMRQERTS
jgi:hypothetical protein